MDKVSVGLIQMMVEENKDRNLKKAEKRVKELAQQGADMVVLPEMFNCPYDNSFFSEYAETYPDGKSIRLLSRLAKEEKIVLVGGSIPEREGDRIYNTSFIFNAKGALLGRHRKMHLFDIDVEGGVRFKESDVLSYGQDVTVVDTPFGKIGVAVCYDIRFPELMGIMAHQGARVIVIPAAFNMTTGPAHWDYLFRVRGMDQQVYMVGTAPARNEQASYLSYGHSLITNPWGEIETSLDEKEGTLLHEIDLKYIDQVRKEIPLLNHKRKDIYHLNLVD